MGYHWLWRERPGDPFFHNICTVNLAGPNFQDWKRKANESGIQGWPLQDGLPHIGDP